jgi:Cu/Ag efflux protein CusF
MFDCQVIRSWQIGLSNFLTFLLTLTALTSLSCQTVWSRDNPDIRRFNLKGVVEFVDQKNCSITVAHESIPEYMPAMTMLFKVRNKNELKPVAHGDQISAIVNYNRQTRESWLENIVVLAKKRGKK